MSVLATSTPMVIARKKAFGNTKTSKTRETSKNGKNNKNRDKNKDLETNFIQVSYI